MENLENNVLVVEKNNEEELTNMENVTVNGVDEIVEENGVVTVDETEVNTTVEQQEEVSQGQQEQSDEQNEQQEDEQQEDESSQEQQEAKTTKRKKAKPTKAKDEQEKRERITRIDKSDMKKTFKFLLRNRDKLKFDLAIQRNEVWNDMQKAGLIDSIIYGYPVPPVMVMETEDGNYWFLDGKQRGTTIVSFMADEWAMPKKAKPVLGFDVAGKKFSELPEEMQDYINEETITLIKLKGLTPEERDEMFVRWNSGTALSKMELTRAKYYGLIEQVNELSELEFFSEDIAMTATGRNRFQDQEVILQIAMLLDKGRDGIKGFGSKEIDAYVMEMKDENRLFTKALMSKFKSISTFMNMASSDISAPQKKKILKKANTPIIFYQALNVMEQKIKPSIYAEFLVKFLDTEYDKDSDYGRTLQSGVSKRDNVITRISEIELEFNAFVEEISKTRDTKDIYKSKK